MYKSMFQKRLHEAMLKRNVKAIELAEKTELTRCQISGYINGRCQPKNDKLYLISQALNVNPMWLMGFDVPINEDEADTRTRINTILNNLEGRQLEKVLAMLELMLEYEKEGNKNE